MPNFEQQWATVLKKTQQQKNTPKQPLAQKRQQIKEELGYFKNQLLKIYQNPNDSSLDINYYLQAVIKVRAKLMILHLEEEKENLGFISNLFIQNEYKKYYLECNKLLKVFSN